MKYQVLQSFCLGSAVDVVEGQTIELLETEAVGFVQSGRLLALPDDVPADSGDAAPARSTPGNGDPIAPEISPAAPGLERSGTAGKP